ncbi:MAG: phosphate/phosphite/phosphonate ABC transporter substrate-binding protein [Candidatus Hydrogenedentota bacterium]|nr:MAG: phosphate/phosphite/phosphonate ABC transporter substrate-binding protein [Candidatus Hydrogenedentota bacterium]
MKLFWKTRFGPHLTILFGGAIVVFLLFLYAEKLRLWTIESLFPNRITWEPTASSPQKNNKGRPDPYHLPKTPFRIAVAPIVSPESSLIRYHGLAVYLGSRFNRPGKIILRDNYLSINRVIQNGECDLAFICTYAYIVGEREGYLKVLAAPVIHGAKTYRSLLIAPFGTTAKNILDFRNKTFASADPLSFSGWLYPMLVLKKAGEDPRHFFSKHIISGSHDRSVNAVADGVVDAAAVDSLIFAAMPEEIRRKVVVIDSSPPVGMPPVVVPSSLDSRTAERYRDVLTTMQRDPEGRSILASLGFDRFVPVTPADYASVREAVRQWETH